MSRRTTIYAAFDLDRRPVLGVWDTSRSRLAVRISDRVANGEAFPGEHVVRITIEYYNRLLAPSGFPPVVPE